MLNIVVNARSSYIVGFVKLFIRILSIMPALICRLKVSFQVMILSYLNTLSRSKLPNISHFGLCKIEFPLRAKCNEP